MRDGIVDSPPFGDRSSLGIAAAGASTSAASSSSAPGAASASDAASTTSTRFPARTASRSSRRATASPRRSAGMTEVVLNPLPPATPNTDRGARCSRCGAAAARRFPQGGAVLGTRHGGGQRLAEEAPVGTSIALRLIFRPEDGDRAGDRRWPGARPRGRPGLPRERERSLPASSRRGIRRTGVGQLADGRRARRRRRSPVRLQRRDDELRARADARPARGGHGVGLRRRRVVHARLRRHALNRPSDPTEPGLDLAPADVLRRLRAGRAAGDLAERGRGGRDPAPAHLQARPAVERDRDRPRPTGRSPSPRQPEAAGHVPGRLRLRRSTRSHLRSPPRRRGWRRPWSTPPTTSAGSRRRCRSSRSTTPSARAAISRRTLVLRTGGKQSIAAGVADAAGTRPRHGRDAAGVRIAPIAVRDAAEGRLRVAWKGRSSARSSTAASTDPLPREERARHGRAVTKPFRVIRAAPVKKKTPKPRG